MMHRTPLCAMALALTLGALPAAADMEIARAAMSGGSYGQARAALVPLARSGNAEAEHMLGRIHGMGLGLPRDEVRAVEWHRRAALKGHPGAQAMLAWHYETGRGLTAPDPLRAMVWYGLAALGADPDAARAQAALAAKMTQDDVDKAHMLIEDYRSWMAPLP